jgi:heat shock protein HslJ
LVVNHVEEPESLVGPWVVERLAQPDGSMTSPIAETTIDVHFHDDRSVTGKAGCNSYRGSYRTEGRSITIQAPVSTRKFCMRPTGVMEQEAQFLKAIVEAGRYSIDDRGRLVITDSTDRRLVLLRRAPSPS